MPDASRLRVLNGDKGKAKNAGVGCLLLALVTAPLWAAATFVTTWFVVQTLHMVGLG